ncbi:hypothetical protein PTTG_26845 [Puccinia triticina 1-1 BBBD Race 1]|uniref:Uncharacterized protein n=1 Tax=Puccinia triticina (isolate 1-1 / race 1 (BBBD)) TaxID=630390 RepID=A0A180GQ25_PUCT1|nr:hypothetical protein PTTG_26845 [Puccinia triticina 1-1 BBBD Race 1]
MHPGFPQNPRTSSSVWSAPAHVESEHVPEGYSIVHTAQPGFYSTRMRNPYPLTYADAYQYQSHPCMLLAEHLVPIVQPRLPHQNMLYPQYASILNATPERHEEIFQRRIKERDEERAVRKAKSSQEVSSRLKALVKPMDSGGGYGGFSGKPQVPELPVRQSSINQPVMSPSVVHKNNYLAVDSDERRQLPAKGLITPTMDFHQGETENQAGRQPKVPKTTSDTPEKVDPSSTKIAEDSSTHLEQKDNSRDLSTPLNGKNKASSPGFPLNGIGGSAYDLAGLRASVDLPTFGKVEDLKNEKFPGSKIKITHPLSGKTVVPVSEAAHLTKTQVVNNQDPTRQKIDVASHNQEETFPPADTLPVQTGQLQQSLPHESENSRAMSVPNKFMNDLEFPQLDALVKPKPNLSENQKTVVASEITYKNVVLKEEDGPISKAKKLTGVAKQKKKIISGSQGTHWNNQNPNPNLVEPHARASAKGLTAVGQPRITRSGQKPPECQAEAFPSLKSQATFGAADATNPNADRVTYSKPAKVDPHFSSGPGSVGGVEHSGLRTHVKTNKAKIDFTEIKNVNSDGLRKGYWEVLGNQASVDSVSTHEETPAGSDQISNPEHPVLPSPEGKENKDEETDGADLRPDQNGDGTSNDAGSLQVAGFDESGKTAGMKASQKRKKKKKKSTGSKQKLDDDWKLLEALEKERNTKITSEKELGSIELKDEKEGQGKGGYTVEEINEGFKLPGPSDKDVYAFINGPIFLCLDAALIPFASKEGHIYPGLPRPKSQRKPLKLEVLENRLKTWKTDAPPSRRFGRDHVKLWRQLGVDLDLMDSISRYMNIVDSTVHLSLPDLDYHTYAALRDVWHRPEDRVKFLVCVTWWMGDVFKNSWEFMRRMKTLAKQVFERTVVDNWNVISKHLVENQNLPQSERLTKSESDRIQKFYCLTVKFPKSPAGAVSPLEERLVPARKFLVLNRIKESLGIETSNTFTRTRPIGLDDLAKGSIVAQNFEELHRRSRYNGLEIEKVLGLLEMFGVDRSTEKQLLESSGKDFAESLADELIPFHFDSPEQHWLRKHYPPELVDQMCDHMEREFKRYVGIQN